MAFLSIIVPVYNSARYLTDTLDSICRQSFTDWECIIVNDGSTDNSQEIINHYCALDCRFTGYEKKNSRCANLARLYGLERVKTEFVTNIDSWKEVMDHYHFTFKEGMVDLLPAADTDAINKPFTYLFDDQYVDEGPLAPWAAAYQSKIVKLAHPENCATGVVTVNFKPADADAYLEALDTKVKAAGYVADESLVSEGLLMYRLSSGNEVVKELIVEAVNGSSVKLLYSADMGREEFTAAQAAQFGAKYVEKVNEEIAFVSGTAGTFASALPLNFGSATPDKLVVDYHYLGDNNDYYAAYGLLASVDLYVYFTDPSATPESPEPAALPAAPTYLEQIAAAYEQALVTAGFEEMTETLFGVKGLFNATSGEFVMLDIDEKEGYLVAQVVVHDATSAEFVKAGPQSDAELVAEIAGVWNEISTASEGAYSAATALTGMSFALGSEAADQPIARSDAFNYGNYSAGLVYGLIQIQYGRALTAADITTLVNALKAKGFVEASFLAWGTPGGDPGLWNPTTFEFIEISEASISGDTLSLYIEKIVEQRVAAWVSIPEA